jgi:serine O-acetyltransferase
VKTRTEADGLTARCEHNRQHQFHHFGLSCLKEDVGRYVVLMKDKNLKSRVRMWLYTPGLWVLFGYRLGRSLRQTLNPAVFRPLLWLYEFFYFLLRLLTGIDVPLECEIGEGLYIGHYGGIIIHPGIHMGRNCNISHGVTIGEGGRGKDRGVPVIGDRVYVAPGAKVFGRITIGNDVAIGANAVVHASVPDGKVIGGIPARILNNCGSSDFVVISEGEAGADGSTDK